MKAITYPNISLAANLKTGGNTGVYQNVVQKGNVGSSYVYAMQLHKKLDSKTNKKVELNSVLRAVPKASPSTPITYGSAILNMKDLACSHSQTWEYAGRKGEWFIGTKGVKTDPGSKYKWATQVARVSMPPDKTTYTKNTQLPRLSHLDQAGGFNINLKRSEAAISPNHMYFLIATIDLNNNGYFSLYRLTDINNALDEYGTTACSITNLQPVIEYPAFSISNMAGIGGLIGSIQGYDIDDDCNIYISSETPPSEGSSSEPRHIYKIPWGADATQQYTWTDINLINNTNVDYKGYATEFESVQVIDENHLYLTVAYHGYYYKKNSKGKKIKTWGTINNRIYEIQW
ncbi:helveticin J family class III bacteriocin [Lactobacillus sp. ESL0681]|uniref:helveticin J family class III bacteriocin n=1 Tax=Lactobacillus sp. ESL0681 TaxID=2983211 RepID=UPI0023F9BE88|nr:helveticin J family class III bacteriocin [Lactobacillus sp. ESL0681]WEV40978.1 helveticin J family class III bacteriocin [Lactobacillus sp. ESL0681]